MNKKGQWRIAIFLVLFIFITGGLVFKFWLAPKIFMTQVDSARDIIDKTYDAENAIYNYEWIKTQHEEYHKRKRKENVLVATISHDPTLQR